MKLGIITFYRPINIGAVLQATATNRIIFNNDKIQSKLIDYRLPRTEFYRKPFNFSRPFKAKGFVSILKAILVEFLFYPKRKKAYNNITKFVDTYLSTTLSSFYTKEEFLFLNKEFDGYVIGSDLVWNPLMTENLDDFFFASFAGDTKLVFSYAASIGQKDIDEQTLKTIAQNIERFKGVSVREKTTKEQLQCFTKKTVSSVLDPTLLTKEDDWDPYICDFKYRNLDYIFVYMLENSSELVSFAEELASQLHCKIITYDSKRKFKFKDTIAVPTIGPSEFLDAIKCAKAVVTNSLHGCAFSLIYKKEFYAFPHSTRSIRMIDLLDDLGLNDRMVFNRKSIIFNRKIDYKLVDKQLDRLRKQSFEFINQSLGVDIYGK